MELIELSGTPYEMGMQHGRRLKEQISVLAQERYEVACEFARERGVNPSREECLQLAREHLTHHESYSSDAFDEWRGIADGAGLTLEEVFFTNALTDFRDVLWQTAPIEIHGCTSFAIASEAATEGTALIGQTWDMHASVEPYIYVFRRRPQQGPTSLTMTAAGCLTLVGVNEAGIAVGNNNLRPMDARPGVTYLAMLHNALRQTEWSAAKRAITDAHRASGHNYIMAHKSGERANIETTATKHATHSIDTPWYVHSNHYLDAELKALEDPDLDRRSSEHRLARGNIQMQSHHGKFSPDDARRLLGDHDGEDLSICRHGEGRDPRSCAFVVADAGQRCLWTSLGPPCNGKLKRYDL